MAGEPTFTVDFDDTGADPQPAGGDRRPLSPDLGAPYGGDGAAEPFAAPAATPPGGWIGAGAAGLALAAWTAFFIWGNRDAMAAGGQPDAWAGWISAWAAPALLITAVWLIAARTSRRESGRFVQSSRLLAEEAGRLEDRLTIINRELALAREFVAAQARDLDSVGRIAVDRLSGHAERLQTLVRDNGAQIDAIGSVSATALENMERLRGQLPVLTSAAKDLTNNFAHAGRAASAQLDELGTGFERLVHSGRASETLVEAWRSQFGQAIDSFASRTAQLEQTIQARSQALDEKVAQFRGILLDQQAEFDTQLRGRSEALSSEYAETRHQLDRQEAECITSLRARLAGLRDETMAVARALRDGEATALGHWREAAARIDRDMRGASETAAEIGRQSAATSNARMARLADEAAALERVLSETGARVEAETARRRHAGEAQDRSMLDRLAAQLAALDEAIAQREATHTAHLAGLVGHGEATTAQLAQIETRIAAIAGASEAAQLAMVQRLDVLGQRLGDGRQQLDATDRTLIALIENGGRLLGVIHSAATHSRQDLAEAIDRGAARLGDLEERALTLREMVIDADRTGQSLSSHLRLAQDRLGEATGAMAIWHADITAKAGSQAQTLDGLKQSVVQLDSQTMDVATRVNGELTRAIELLDTAARAAVDMIERRGAASVAALARQLGAESGDAIERAMRLQVAEISGKLEQAAAHAAGVSRQAALQMREQLDQVNDLVGNLEGRVDQARARAEERVDDDFARRVALITDALNSNAIDIAKALDTEISDTAWSAYLKGDRGIFTRRAVRLLDPPEARGIMQLFQNDDNFREYVSHYIHDFEAMLRQLLSTRDGHALGVTLLSSDMGKLYVVLAQAIERLRN